MKEFKSLELAKASLLKEISVQEKTFRNGRSLKEVIGTSFTIPLFSEINFSQDQLHYANEKIIEYKDDIKRVSELFSNNKDTRQASIVFKQNQDMPNCILSNSFIFTDNSLDCFVFSRSLDVNSKLECDVLIAQKMAYYIVSQGNKVEKDKSKLHFVCVNAHIYL
jgi:thymidylate synthase